MIWSVLLFPAICQGGLPLDTTRLWCSLLAVLAWLVTAPARGQQGGYPSTQPAPSPFLTTQPAPPVTLGDSIAPADTWDPYDTSGSPPPTVAPQGIDPYGTDPYGQPNPSPFGQAIYGGAGGQRLIQQIKAEYTFLGATGGNGSFQVQDAEVSGTLTFPFLYNVAPLLVTPGFATHWWAGPTGGPNLPPRVYDLYVDFGWRPQVSPWLSLDLGARPGLFSDFSVINSSSFRIQARGLAIFTASPQIQIVAGVLYLDRNFLKILPAGGVIWTPTEDTRYEILFPRPKLAQRIHTFGNTDWWIYIAGELGGGAWQFQQPGGTQTNMDYDDLRVSVGTEWFAFHGMKGYFEAGFVFDRQLLFTNGTPKNYPNNTYMLRAGLSF